MAGLLYLPRVFVYHSEAIANNKSEDVKSTFKIMEKRLFIYIMNPAMIVSWILGGLLIYTIGIDNLSSLFRFSACLFNSSSASCLWRYSSSDWACRSSSACCF